MKCGWKWWAKTNGSPSCRRDPGAAVGRAEHPQLGDRVRAGDRAHTAVARAEVPAQLRELLLEELGRGAAQRHRRAHVGARRAAETEVDAAGVQGLEHPEALGDGQRRVVGEHHARPSRRGCARCAPRGARSGPRARSRRPRGCCGARRPRSGGSRGRRRGGRARSSRRARRRRSRRRRSGRGPGRRGECSFPQGRPRAQPALLFAFGAALRFGFGSAGGAGMSSASASSSQPMSSATSGICARSATIPKSRWPQ